MTVFGSGELRCRKSFCCCASRSWLFCASEFPAAVLDVHVGDEDDVEAVAACGEGGGRGESEVGEEEEARVRGDAVLLGRSSVVDFVRLLTHWNKFDRRESNRMQATLVRAVRGVWVWTLGNGRLRSCLRQGWTWLGVSRTPESEVEKVFVESRKEFASLLS